MGGWDEMRQRLKGKDGVPMFYVFDTCTNLIRTLPVAPHDVKRAEDLATDCEDHALDAARYACMSRPWVPERPVPEKKGDGTGYSEKERDEYSIKAL